VSGRKAHMPFASDPSASQEPIARLHYRGHPNRRLRVLEVAEASPGDEIYVGDKPVGRVTSAVPGRAFGFVRREVPDYAVLRVGSAEAGFR
jgi:folate-binding Fe-S cluster repair protein YgfZ